MNEYKRIPKDSSRIGVREICLWSIRVGCVWRYFKLVVVSKGILLIVKYNASRSNLLKFLITNNYLLTNQKI